MDPSQPTRAPTALAVALGYDPATDDAPRVTASGRGAFAEQLLEIAFANGVKVREDADLAEILAAVDVESPIPPAVFATVAGILSYVYRINGRLAEFHGRPVDATPGTAIPGRPTP